jgi:hypothetical protein
MKSTLALLCLSLSAMAWAGAPGAAAPPIAASPSKNSTPEVPEKNDYFDADPKKFKCLESCQRPILHCMSRCSNDPECPERCKAQDLARCAESCNMLKKK